MNKKKRKKLEICKPTPQENIELEISGSVNGNLFQDAIAITEHDKLTYQALDAITDDETMSLVGTPLMSRAKDVVENRDFKYSTSNILRFLADLKNRDVSLIKERSNDLELAGSYVVDRTNAFYSSIYVDIYTDLAVLFTGFVDSFKDVCIEKSLNIDKLISYLFKRIYPDSELDVIGRISYDDITSQEDSNYFIESLITRLTAQIIRYAMVGLNDGIDVLFFANTVLPNYINEIVYMVRYTFSLANSYNYFDTRKVSGDTEEICNIITIDLLPLLHNNILEIYSKYCNILSQEDVISLITAQNVPGITTVISPEDKGSGLLFAYNVYNETN